MIEHLVLIEYHDYDGVWHPFRVEVSNGQTMKTFDFEWCKRDDTLYYDNVGGGPDDGTVSVDKLCDGAQARIWINSAYTPVANTISRESIADLSALGWYRLDGTMFDPFNDALESETVYCGACDDHLPDWSPCDHIWWCGIEGCWRGATGEDGADGPCADEDCEGCSTHRAEIAS